MSTKAGKRENDDKSNSDDSQQSQQYDEDQEFSDENTSESSSNSGSTSNSDFETANLEENNNPREICYSTEGQSDDDEEEAEWCDHLEESSSSGIRHLFQKSLKCLSCRKPALFSCIHQNCIRGAKTNCCKNLKHLLGHMATHDHPVIVHHKMRVILCTNCNVRSTLRQFMKHSTAPNKSIMGKEISPNTRRPIRQKGLLGYLNFGNTCYMNAVLQLLGHCTPFSQYLIDLIPPGGWANCPQEIQKTIIQMALDLRNKHSALPLPYLNPWKIITCVRNELPGFDCFQQQDASEFLRSLLDVLDRDLKSCGEYYNHNLYIGLGSPDEDYTIAMNAKFTKTAISAIFQGVLENQITCHTCGFQSRTMENFLDLSIPLVGENEIEEYINIASKNKTTEYNEHKPKMTSVSQLTDNDGPDPGFLVYQGMNHKTDLDACLNRFFQSTVLQDENQYLCRNCETHVNATKSTKALKLPEVILIQLKRFRHTMYGSCKVGKVVQFPLRTQDFGRWTKSGKPALYDLIGFIVHEGKNLEFGHYVTFCKHEQDNQWYKFDDLSVKRYDVTQVAENHPYILMFQRRTSKREPSILEKKTDSPYNFFKCGRILTDKGDSEAWDVIQKCLEESKPQKKEFTNKKLRNLLEKKRKKLIKKQIIKLLSRPEEVSYREMENHYLVLQRIMDDIVESLANGNQKQNQNHASQSNIKEALDCLVAAMESWFKFMIKKKWMETQTVENGKPTSANFVDSELNSNDDNDDENAKSVFR